MAGIFLAYVGWYLCPVHARRGGGLRGVFGCTGNFSFHRLDIYDTIDVALLVIFITLFYFLFIPNPGSENFIFHPGSASKNLSILPKKLSLSSRKYDPGCSSWIRILIFYPSWIPEPGVKKEPDVGSGPGSGSATLLVMKECHVSAVCWARRGDWRETTAPRIRIQIFYPSRIPDPGVKKAPDPGSGSAALLRIPCTYIINVAV